MSQQNALSSCIEIFPISVNRNVKNNDGETESFHNGRALTEQNLSSILNKLSDDPHYVLDKGSEYIEFIIKGHYFKLTDTDILEFKPLYVGISFNTDNPNFVQLSGQDSLDNNTKQYIFTDVIFNSERMYTSDTKPDGYTGTVYDYVLQLLDSEGNIPIESKYRFTGDSIKNINGGTV